MGLGATPAQSPPQTQHNDLRSQRWHVAYMAALFEADRKQIGTRIKEAERLVFSRERELFVGQADPTEQRALNNALHALHALRSCLGV